MKAGSSIWFLVVSFIFAVCQADLLDYASELPSCALDCLLDTIPNSACGSIANSTCICHDADLFRESRKCMVGKCTVMQQLSVARIEQEACNKPKRERRDDIPGLLVLSSFALGCLLVRLSMRWTTAKQFEWDDVVVGVLLLVFLAFWALGQYLRCTAIGYDIWNLKPSTVNRGLKFFFIDEMLYILILALCRIGVLMFLRRAFGSLPSFKRLCHIVIVWVVLTAVVFILMTLFQCWPISANWRAWSDESGLNRCLNLNALSYAVAGMGIAQDVVVLVLPLPLILHLKMPLNQKLPTLLMFSLGVFVTVISCIRLRYLLWFARSRNPTYDNTDAVIWTEAEVQVSVIVLCLPSIRILLARYLPGVFGSSRAKTSRATKGAPGESAVLYKYTTKQSSDVPGSTPGINGKPIQLQRLPQAAYSQRNGQRLDTNLPPTSTDRLMPRKISDPVLISGSNFFDFRIPN
ncbi:hypothetical protein F4780DRAFT_724715 [Xylariomycetidae sp. FL0641]|nr:hypothetical protein F4780DRAFT_724715 [Xylariomycetidae sp. FL0641]